MSFMHAVQIKQYGSTDVLEYTKVTRPTPGEGEVLIRAQAASVNPFDCAVRAGYIAGYYQYTFPLIPGLDVAGVVEAVGPGVTQFTPGSAVYARTNPARNGAYAEYVLARVEEVASAPKSLDPVHAAAVPHVGLVASALVDAADLSQGKTVLIHAAAGGVGHFAAQLARLRGARVIGTASGANLAFLRELGVDQAVDYTKAPFESVVKNVDVVFDMVGGETQDRSFQTLKPGGILFSIVQMPSPETAASFGVRQQFMAPGEPGGAQLAKLGALLDSGELKVTVSQVLPLSEIQQAHKQVEGHHTRGKLVLEIV
jgi:NADPH:quinone reductase-like Zn-dependent oxidoreductase